MLTGHVLSVARRCRTSALVVASLAGLLVAASHASPATAAATAPLPRGDGPLVSVPDVPAARLHVRIVTTSDWTRLQLAPGEIVSERVISASDGAEVEPLADGWRVRHAGERAVVEIDAVFAEITDAQRFRATVDKGFDGATRVVARNLNGIPFDAVTVTNTRRSLLDPDNRVTVRRDRGELFGTVPLDLPSADPRPLVLAFYYAWFDGYDDPRLQDRPARPRSTLEYAGVRSMSGQARANGIDGFIVSWAGEANDGEGFDLAVRAAEETGGLVTGYLETLRAPREGGAIDAGSVGDWLLQLLQRADSSAFLRADDGVPVVFVWRMDAVPPEAWSVILDDLAAQGHPVHLVGDTAGERYRPVTWGWHHYRPGGTEASRTRTIQEVALDSRAPALLHDETRPRIVAGGVAPGYRTFGLDLEPRLAGQRYDATWRATLAGDPDWVVITSWNEWFEATSIEPSATFGSRAIEQTAWWARVFDGR